MTKEEKIDMFAMRLDGHSLAEIGQRYGISRERVRQILSVGTRERGGFKYKDYIYPNILNWMQQNHVSAAKASEMIGIHKNCFQAYMTGKRKPSFIFVSRILEITSLPFEIAFEKREPDLEVET